MALAINLLFDAGTASAVGAVWAELAAKGVTRDMIDLNYPPHVTLVVVEHEALEPDLRVALTLGAGLTAMPMVIGPVRRFEGTSINWLACDGGAGLRDVHKAVAASVPLEAIRTHYRPDQWVPHMTLQTQGDAEAGGAIARAMWPAEKQALAIRLEICRFVPVVPLGGIDLTLSTAQQ